MPPSERSDFDRGYAAGLREAAEAISTQGDHGHAPNCETCALGRRLEARAEPWICPRCDHKCVNAKHDHLPCPPSNQGAHSGMLGSCCIQEVRVLGAK